MFTRRFKQMFARFAMVLLFMQAAVAAYACPPFLADVQAAGALRAALQVHEASPVGDCEQQHRPVAAEKSTCHQHYAGDQSVGTVTLASASVPPMSPLAIMPAMEPAPPVLRSGLPVLLQRNTAPPLSIRFQVLRI